MRNIKLTIEYEGTNYSGWQFQTNGTSIQELIQKALLKITGEKLNLKGASRTDAGVHALGQVANFKTESTVPMAAFKEGLNSILPEDIIIKDACEADPDFDPIKSAIKKSYRYCIQTGDDKSIVTRKFSWNVKKSLDLESIITASRDLVGEHDFEGFQGHDADTKTTVRNIHSINFEKGPLGLLFLDFTANGFLKYMIRNIMGTLVEIGSGKRKVGCIKDILESKDRRTAGPTAPAWGLFLLKVYY
jgi:tRNA pseudouridine38-40 synthase